MTGLLISKSLALLLLPPGSLILLGTVGLICWRRRWGRWLVAGSLALLWLLSTEPVRDALVHPLESKYRPYTYASADSSHTAIALLGGGIYELAPEYDGRDSLGMYAMMRTTYAAGLASRTGMPVFVSGGRPLRDTGDSEGKIMKEWLVRLGVPKSRIHAETGANNTWENAVNLKPMLKKMGIRKVVVITSAWHMPRAMFCFSRQQIAAIPAPCNYLEKRIAYDLRSFLPSWTAFNDSAHALHEYLGLVWYRMRYA